jgi:hypothetical protein
MLFRSSLGLILAQLLPFDHNLKRSTSRGFTFFSSQRLTFSTTYLYEDEWAMFANLHSQKSVRFYCKTEYPLSPFRRGRDISVGIGTGYGRGAQALHSAQCAMMRAAVPCTRARDGTTRHVAGEGRAVSAIRGEGERTLSERDIWSACYGMVGGAGSTHPVRTLAQCTARMQEYFAHLGYGMDGRGSIPGRDKRFFCTPHCSDCFWGPPSLLSNGYRTLFHRE